MPMRSLVTAALAASALFVAAPARADDAIRIEVSKAELLRFNARPGSVLVADPKIADVVADGGRHVFVLGKAPGETKLFVLDAGGQTLMAKTVRVVAASANQVTVYRGADETTTLNCSPSCAPPPDEKHKAAASPASAPAAAPTAL